MNETYIPVEECETGAVYALRARNLTAGVYDGNGGFIGIREKFNDRTLDREYHWDTSARRGTARPIRRLGVLSPEVPIAATTGSVCAECRCPVSFSRVDGEWLGVWMHDADGENHDVRPIGVPNRALVNALETFDKRARQVTRTDATTSDF